MTLQDIAGKQYTHSDGYEISFTKQPPQELQLECSICLQLLSDPCLVGCKCGSNFCRECIETTKAHNNSRCPLCKDKFGTILPNNQLGRTLNRLLVYCPHSKEGCSWEGQLGNLSEHFNQTPTDSTRLDGCGFTAIMCRFCEESLPRKNIPEHEAELCPNKPYTCQYCGHSSIFNDITENHWPICPKFPLPCPYECGEEPPREELENHVVSICELAPVECEFKYAGCEVGELPKREMAGHLREKLVEHTTLLAVKQKSELEEMRAENESLNEEIEKIQSENQRLNREINTLKIKHSKEMETVHRENCNLKRRFEQEIEVIKKEVVTLKRGANKINCELESQVQDLAQSLSRIPIPSPPEDLVPPVELVMRNFKRLRVQRNQWNSRPFFSAKGYKMLLNVVPYGEGDGLGSHISVFICLLMGDDDDILRWPFRGEITLSLIDQRRYGRNYSTTIDFDDADEEHGERRYNNCLTNGYGDSCFFEYNYLNPNYLKDDCLIFRIEDICNEW